MPDDQVHLPRTADASAQPTNGSANRETHPQSPPDHIHPPAGSSVVGQVLSPFDSIARWILGALILVAVQLTFYLGLGQLEFSWLEPRDPAVVGFLILLNIALTTVFCCEVLERCYWLSRLLRLPIVPDKRPIGRSLIWAIAGPLAVYVYTQQVSKPRLEAAKSSSEIAHQPADNTREIVETVVFVVVLVLLLKSFTAEAFVIPTGSMAETLWGYQKVVTCPECKYQFPVNASQEADPQEGKPLPVVGCTCPNCLKTIRFEGETRGHVEFKLEHPDAAEIPDPGWTSGDRVLVAKFLYELFGNLPNRLDVVVFKFPGDEMGSPWPSSGPVKSHVPINYIKRLVGLPGEMIAIKGGKLYILSPEKVRDLPAHAKLDDLAGLTGEEREQTRLQLWRKPYLHVDESDARQAFIDAKFAILKKPPEVILSMRRIVYDNDHQPSDQTKSNVRWPATDEWSANEDHGFVHKGEGEKPHWLRYRNILRGSDHAELIGDSMGYNNNYPSRSSGRGRPAGENWVSDLLLECEAVVEKAEGELVLELSKGEDRFRAAWDLSNGRCTLIRLADGKQPETLGSTETKLKKGTYSLRFANVDRRLTVWVDNRVVEWAGGKAGVDYDAPASDLPTDNDLQPASIGAVKSGVRVQKLKLWRDTYYTVDASTPDAGSIGLSKEQWSDPSAWQGKDKKLPFKTLYVQPGHFLCMGDNSPQSSDGRNWGLVPERLLLGRAQVVYYPFYFPWPPLSSQVNRVELIR